MSRPSSTPALLGTASMAFPKRVCESVLMREIRRLVASRFDPDRTLRNRHELSRLKRARLAQVGWGTYGVPRVTHYGEEAKLEIGNYCSIAIGVEVFLGGNHRIDWTSTYPFSEFQAQYPSAAGIQGHPATRGDVVIGHDVWIGAGATIMSGVSVGTGAVLGARAVVTRDVPSYAVVVGNPGRVVRYRFPEAFVELLLESQWWTVPPERIGPIIGILMSSPDTNRLNQLSRLVAEMELEG